MYRMRSCECIIWKERETPPFESLSVRGADTSIGITFSITLLLAKPLFTCQRNILLVELGKAAEGFLGSSQNQERKSGIHQLLPKRDIEQTWNPSAGFSSIKS